MNITSQGRLYRYLSSSRRLSSCALTALSVLSVSTTSAAFVPGSILNGSFATRTYHSSTAANAMSDAAATRAATTTTSPFVVAQFPCLDDNYGYLVHDPITGQTAAIDTPCARTYQSELDKRGWKLTHIFNTHHHGDHTGGNVALKKTSDAKIVGPVDEKTRIPGIDVAVGQGDVVEFGNKKASVLDVGGHTKGHIAYHFDTENSAFVGDALFVLGCGRMFEGTPEQFWTSLKRLRELPDETKVYCAHEYTASNAKFAMSVEPNNVDLQEQVAKYTALRAKGEPTVPSLIGDEKKANPFLRCDSSAEIRSNVGVVDGDTNEQAFGKVRKAKDNF